MTTQQEIMKSIVEEFHLDALPEAQRAETLARIGGILYQAILLRCLEKMPEEDQVEFEKILDADGAPEDIFGFLEAHTENFGDIAKEEVEKFKNESNELMEKAME
jgi:hypothetical protein